MHTLGSGFVGHQLASLFQKFKVEGRSKCGTTREARSFGPVEELGSSDSVWALYIPELDFENHRNHVSR
jgi:hypothetical protein